MIIRNDLAIKSKRGFKDFGVLKEYLRYFYLNEGKKLGIHQLHTEYLWNWIPSDHILSDLSFIQEFMQQHHLTSRGEILCFIRKDGATSKKKIRLGKNHVQIIDTDFLFKQTYYK